MKVLIILSVVTVISCQFPQWEQLVNTSQPAGVPGVDLPGVVVSQLSTLTKQLEGLQGILQSMSQQFSSMVRTSTRLVEGLQSDITNPMTGLTDTFNALVSSMNQLTSQFALIQRTLSDVTSNLQRMVTSSTRIIGANPMYQAEPWTNMGETILRSLEDVTRQMESTAAVLRDLNGSWSRLIESGSRLVSGLQSEQQQQQQQQQVATAPPPTPAPGTQTGSNSGTGSLASTQTVTNTTTVTQGLTGSDTNSGPAGVANNVINRATNPTETIMKAADALNEQMGAAQKIAADLTQQLSKLVQTAGKVVTGNRDLSPIEAGLNSVSEMTRQFTEFQNVLRSLNNQFNRMLESGTKMIGGDESPSLYADSTNTNSASPADAIFAAAQSLNEQAASLQRALTEMSSQLSRMFETSTRVITGNPSTPGNLRRQKRADARIVEALQIATATMTRQLGQLGATMARIAGGATGVRVLGGGASDSRGALDSLSNLNPLAAIGRQVGNIAGSLTRVLPSG